MEPELKIYTIVDLRKWLIDNNPPIGLSEQVIAPVRAYAILNNPYVEDEDAIVAAIYVGDELAAYTACFPDMHEGKRIWWASTLWCNSQYQGQGFGLIVVGCLQEAHESEPTLDRWGAQETQEIFKALGHSTMFSPRYVFGDGNIHKTTWRGRVAYLAQEAKKKFHRLTCKLPHSEYTLTYSTFVDGEAYAFMQAHRGNDAFLREQKMVNWIIRYPFMVGCELPERIKDEMMFSGHVTKADCKVVKVYAADRLIGVYAWNAGSVLYLYYEETAKLFVWNSIVEHVYRAESGLRTDNKGLASYVSACLYFPKRSEIEVSLSLPFDVVFPGNCTFQLGDGDNFA